MWSVPSVSVASVEPSEVSAAELQSGVEFTVKGTGFKTSAGSTKEFALGPFVSFVKHGSVLSDETLAKGLFSDAVVCTPPKTISFTVQSAAAEAGDYDLFVAQPGDGTVHFAIVPNALKIG